MLSPGLVPLAFLTPAVEFDFPIGGAGYQIEIDRLCDFAQRKQRGKMPPGIRAKMRRLRPLQNLL